MTRQEIKLNKARKIMYAWHGGQWSAFYQFASSGEYLTYNILKYLRECEDCLHPEFALYPTTLSKKDETELNWLKAYFVDIAKQHGFEIGFFNHSVYHYLIPYVIKGNTEKIEPLHYLV